PTGLNGEGADFTAYSSTKGGIHSMVRATAKAYAAEGIRVNTVVPGYTETSLVTTIADDPGARAAIVGRTPLGRPGAPEDVTGIMVYLASDEASFAPGAIVPADGGVTSLSPLSSECPSPDCVRPVRDDPYADAKAVNRFVGSALDCWTGRRRPAEEEVNDDANSRGGDAP